MASAKVVVAAGFIIFRRQAQNIEYLVMKHTAGHWGPPKGHVDAGETEFQAAVRETQEEAGLAQDQLTVVDNFQSELRYQAFGKPKRVVFWLSELKDPHAPITLSHEHTDFKWLPLEEACQVLHFEDMQKSVREAHSFLLQAS